MPEACLINEKLFVVLRFLVAKIMELIRFYSCFRSLKWIVSLILFALCPNKINLNVVCLPSSLFYIKFNNLERTFIKFKTLFVPH